MQRRKTMTLAVNKTTTPDKKRKLIIALIMVHMCSFAFAQAPDEAPSSVDTVKLIDTKITHDNLTDPEALELFMDGAMAGLMEIYNVPGATVSVVKDGKLFFSKGYGFADVDKRVPVDPAVSMFQVASISKLFTWTAVMQLWEQGKVDLDMDINNYLDFKIPDTYPEPITLTHLLTHTAGFDDRAKGVYVNKHNRLEPFGEVLASNIPARVRPPGKVASYSNYGTALAGYIVQRLSGIPFEEYIEQSIYVPLGMTRSTFRQPVPPELKENLVIGYSWQDGKYEAQEYELAPARADGAMSTTAEDMARFMIAHLQEWAFRRAADPCNRYCPTHAQPAFFIRSTDSRHGARFS